MGVRRIFVVAGRRVVLTDHAVERYVDRIRHDWEPEAAELDLTALLESVGTVDGPPEWRARRGPGSDYEDSRFWAYLGDGIAFPLLPDPAGRDYLVAMTCMTKGGMAASARKARSRRQKLRRGARRGPKFRGGRPSPEPEADLE